MPEMTAAEAAEKVESFINYAGDTLDDALGFNLRRTIGAASSILRRVASGELAPVIHAHWTGGYAHKGDVWTYTQPQCSNCHNAVIGGTTKYCPSCGALMDGKDDEDAEIH
jgi:hypothetical protein